jgi:DNA-binding CsgD family transcriptional regulator
MLFSLIPTFHPAGCNDMSGVNSDACQLGAEEERILTAFTGRLIEITAVTSARGPVTPATSLLNSMHLPAIALDRCGFVVDVNAAAAVVFDDDVKVKDKRLFVRDLEARTLLKASLDSSANPVGSQSLVADPIIVQRRHKLPVILRIWPFEGAAHSPEQEVRALVTLNALGPKPGPSAAILAKTFQLTTPEAKLACIIARGAPLQIAARDLEIPWETARKRLKSVFAKTYTHRQSELVALLLQVD